MNFKLALIVFTSFADLNFAKSSPILTNFATNLTSYGSANELGIWIDAVEVEDDLDRCEAECTHSDTVVRTTCSAVCEEGKQAVCLCAAAVGYDATCGCQ